MHKFWQALLISLLLGLGGMWLVLPSTFSSETLATLASAEVGPLLLGLLSIIGWWLLAGYRNQFLVKLLGSRISLWQGIQTHILGVFSAAVSPGGGGNSIGIAWVLTRYGIALDTAVAVTVLTLVGNMAFYGWAVPVAFFYLVAEGIKLPLDYLGLLVIPLALAALIISFLLVFRLRYATALCRGLLKLPFLRRFRQRMLPFLAELELAGQRFAKVAWYWHLWFHFISALSWLLFFAFLNTVLLALHLDVLQLVALSVQIIIHAFAFAVPTPGASGYQEAALTLSLRAATRQELLSAAIILWRGGTYYLYFFLGPLVGGLALLNKRTPDSSNE